MNCQCRKCLDGVRDGDGWPVLLVRMVLCETCGNKRCPHATDHELACTNSNEPGQVGSAWEHVERPSDRKIAGA